MLGGDPGRAHELASRAQQLAASQPGKRLEALSSWLMRHGVLAARPLPDGRGSESESR
jgi:hypothetical protein